MLGGVDVGEDEKVFGGEAVTGLVGNIEVGFALAADGDGREEAEGFFDYSSGVGEAV